MIYLEQVKLNDRTWVEGNVEELKYPFRASAVRYMESIVFRKPVTFLVGENGAQITPYEETEHYQLTRYFLTHTEQMLKELLG